MTILIWILCFHLVPHSLITAGRGKKKQKLNMCVKWTNPELTFTRQCLCILNIKEHINVLFPDLLSVFVHHNFWASRSHIKQEKYPSNIQYSKVSLGKTVNLYTLCSEFNLWQPCGKRQASLPPISCICTILHTFIHIWCQNSQESRIAFSFSAKMHM